MPEPATVFRSFPPAGSAGATVGVFARKIGANIPARGLGEEFRAAPKHMAAHTHTRIHTRHSNEIS